MTRLLLLLASFTSLAACSGGGVKGDADGDGFAAEEDCDDSDASVNPGASEVCDGADDDCNGLIDDGVLLELYADGDGDGYGWGPPEGACEEAAGFVLNGDDCDDDEATVHPGADELCNEVDDDCDGDADNGDGGGATWYIDADGDGFGEPSVSEVLCGSTVGWADNALDCDDGDATVNPGAEEVCGDLDDDDCDGLSDVGEEGVWYDDTDGDGYGHPALSETTCEPQEGWVQDNTDCRPTDPTAYPGAEEQCNEIDDNCDGQVDEGMDDDHDGFLSDLCPDGDDCDDNDANVFPGNDGEICDDGIDTDCDGLDLPCGFYGSYSNMTPDLQVYSSASSYGFGLLVDVGDATGDGVPDVLGSTLYADSYGGGGFIVPGTAASMGTQAAQDIGFRLYGRSSVTYGAGRSIGIADIDGDGVEDVGFGAPYGSYAGTYVAMGPITADFDLSDPDAYLACTSGIYCGHGGDFGDVTGDGVSEVMVGAYYDSSGGSAAGATYVLYGPITGDETLATAANKIVGDTPGSYTGRFMHAGKDVDGDGLGDLLVAAPYATGAAGRTSGIVYLVLGPASITDFGSADARLLGAGPSGLLGEGGPMGIGDLDGDGYGDVVVGSASDSTGSTKGAAWAMYGPVSGDIDLHSADITVTGSSSSQHIGSGVSIGDINNDGVGELLVGASGDNTSSASGGAAYLYFALASGTYVPGDADASFLDSPASFRVGTSVVLDDLNGDGDADVILGAPYDSTGGYFAGGLFVHLAVR